MKTINLILVVTGLFINACGDIASIGSAVDCSSNPSDPSCVSGSTTPSLQPNNSSQPQNAQAGGAADVGGAGDADEPGDVDDGTDVD